MVQNTPRLCDSGRRKEFISPWVWVGPKGLLPRVQRREQRRYAGKAPQLSLSSWALRQARPRFERGSEAKSHPPVHKKHVG